MRKLVLAIAFLTCWTPYMAAKDTPFQVVSWTESGREIVRFSFAKFKMLSFGQGKEHGYLVDTTAENLTDARIGNLDLNLYIFDKADVRIGEGTIHLSAVAPHQSVKFELTLYATGTPARLSLAGQGPRMLSITVNSVPQGALLQVDGKDVGTTPKLVEVSLGKHTLVFSKEGFNSGHFPLEMGPRDVSGGSVSYELGTANHDTLELRDGSLLSGDLLSISGMKVEIRIGGATQTFDRNQIKRILLTTRDPAHE